MSATNVTDILPANHLKDYSVVLSVTMLLMSTIFGSGVSLVTMVTIITSKSLKKLRCALFMSLLAANLAFGFIWVPLEIVQLFQYKINSSSLHGLKHANHALYICIISVIACTLFAISVQSLLFLLSKKHKLSRRWTVYVGVPGSWIIGIIVTVVYIAIAVSNEKQMNEHVYHLIVHPLSFHVKISVLTIYVVSFMIMLFVMALQVRIKHDSTSDYGDSSSSSLSSSGEPNEGSVCLPTIEEPDTEDADVDRVSDTKVEPPAASPSPKVNCRQEEKDISRVDLPQQNKNRKNSLTINFGNMLSRRRHTICQIGDTGPQLSPVERANQYNYVRKFSVDVLALQAQLENPKILGIDRAFHSQQELSMKEVDTNSIRKSGTSLASIREDEDHVENEDVPSDNAQSADDTGMNEITEHLTRKQSIAMRHLTLRLRVVKLAAMMLATFLLTMLPVYITETLNTNVNIASYVNVITYTTAVSSLQAIAYPQFILRLDRRIKDTMRALLHRVRDRVMGQPKHEIHVTGPDDETIPCNNTQC